MAEKYYGVNTYGYCAGNPILLVDANGKDIYRFDRKTGDFILYKTTDDEYDIIGSFRKRGDNYEPKNNKRGEIIPLVDKIEKGILKNGINFRNEDNYIRVGSGSDPSVEGVQNFILNLSNLVDKEIGGYFLSEANSDDVKFIKISKYINNTDTRAVSGNPYSPTVNSLRYNARVNFHTHLSKFPDSSRLVPSEQTTLGGDIGFKNRQLKNNPTMLFMIITTPSPFYY